MAEGGFRERHKSVSNYEANTNLGSFAANTGAGLATGGRRRSSVAFAGSISGAAGQQGENVLNMQDETLRKMSVAVPNLAELSTDARAGAESERKMSFREGVRLYPKAMFFSFGLSLAVIMEGYDTWLLGNFFGMEAFAKKYGGPAGIVDGVQTYQISATWQTAISNSTAAAQIIGLFFNGIISERIGYRKTMMGALFAITCFIFVTFFAVNIHMLLAGYVLSGLPWYVKSLCFFGVSIANYAVQGASSKL
jgi:SP family general alpha glucoside:H+ symporter-like MFS transporter